MPRDIEEFLKMAAKRRQQQKKQGGRPAQRPAGGQQQQQRKPPPRTRTAPPRQTILPATDDEIVIIGGSAAPPAEPDPYAQGVAEHVRSHIDTSDLVEHAQQLGGEVALADDKLDARLQTTFDHKVGSLRFDTTRSAQSTTTTTTKKAVSPLANDLLEMLSNPKSIRQAILISEVLKRPNFD